MSGTRRNLGVGLAGSLALLMVFALGLSTVFAQGPMRVSGGGEAVAGDVTYQVGAGTCGSNVDPPGIGNVNSGTGPGSVAEFDSTGNRITFDFNARVDGQGNVRGQMQMVDHTLGLVIHSDVATLEIHPTCDPPAGLEGDLVRMRSSVEGVRVNGVPQPGWRLDNSPAFDGGEPGAGIDTVCFELFRPGDPAIGEPAFVKVRQWSAFLSSGNVQIVP